MKRVPPPPPGSRKGAPPSLAKPSNKIPQSQEVVNEDGVQEQSNLTPKVPTTVVEQKPSSSPREVEKQITKQATKAADVSVSSKTKPPAPARRNVPGLPQKPKTTPAQKAQELAPVNDHPQSKTSHPPLASQQVSYPSNPPSQEEKFKSSHINKIKSKLDEVLNARSLLLDDENLQESEQDSQIGRNDELIDLEAGLRQEQQPVDSNSEQFEQIKEESNSSSAKQIKQENVDQRLFVQKSVDEQRLVQGERIDHSSAPPKPEQAPLEQPAPESPQPEIQEDKSQDMKTRIRKLKARQSRMNQQLELVHNTLVLQEQRYLQRIEELRRKLAEKQFLIVRLRSN